MKISLFAFMLLSVLLYAPSAGASSFADSLVNSFRIEPCCASPIAVCAAQKPKCKMAPRLADFVRWMDSTGRVTNERMVEALQERYNTLTDRKRNTSDLQGWPVIGDRNAPLTVVMYYSITCPVCKTNFRELQPAVTRGPLQGKVRIVAKPLGAPLNKALIVAHDFGRFADFKLALAAVGGRIDEQVILAIADDLFFDRELFMARMDSPDVVSRLEASSEEAKTNQVEFVPTYFINGRRYNSVSNPRWIIDAIEYVYETEFSNR